MDFTKSEAFLEHLKFIYICELCGAGLSENDKVYLQLAKENVITRKMFDNLKELYHSPEMINLLKDRPSHKRWGDLMMAINMHEKEMSFLDFLAPNFSFFKFICRIIRKPTSVKDQFDDLC